MNHTDYTLPNAADDASRDQDVLYHSCERSWVEEKSIFLIDLSRLTNVIFILYGKLSETCKHGCNDAVVSENISGLLGDGRGRPRYPGLSSTCLGRIRRGLPKPKSHHPELKQGLRSADYF